jgi:hypothetical protein
MPDYVRVATFEADEAALDALVAEINSHDGPPEGVPAKSIMVLADRSAGKLRVVARFGSEDDLKAGSKVLDAMNPPANTNVRRVSVEAFEVVLDRQAP